MAESSVITQAMRDTIGVDGPPTHLEVDKTAVRMFARSVGHTDPVFYDEAEARRRGFRSLPTPPGYLGTPVYHPRAAEADAPAGPARFSTPYKRILNAGTDIEYLGDICAGDTLTSRSHVVEFAEREGSLGPMLITTTETVYTNQDGVVVAKSRGNLIQY